MSHRLSRLLEPRSVAIVGLSRGRRRFAAEVLAASGLEIVAINPRAEDVGDIRGYRELAAVGHPVDAVLALVNARSAIEIVAEAAELGVGGVVVNAAGFAEVDRAGEELQKQLVVAARGMPVLGPNCNGFVNVGSGAFLSGAPRIPLQAGSIGIVTHSGAFITDLAVASTERGIGFSKLISTGNEASVDMTECLDYLISDAETTAIGLVVEGIRRPREFFQRALESVAGGKPIVALKLGRSDRGTQVAASHTGALMGQSWVVESAFRQFGIIPARDLADLLDRLALFAQLPGDRWNPARSVGIVTVSGGAATLASDVCEQEGLDLPTLEELRPAVSATLPHVGSINPVDMTGTVMRDRAGAARLVNAYASSRSVDTVLALWTVGLPEREFAEGFIAPVADAADKNGKPTVLSAIGDATVADWAGALREKGIAVVPGLRGAVRALTAMRDFADAATLIAEAGEVAPATRLARPVPDDLVDTPAGTMLSFTRVMDLLSNAGIPTAPYHLITDADDARMPPFAPPYVVKLADCPHRTDIGAVALRVAPDEVSAQVRRLFDLADKEGLQPRVVVQPHLEAEVEMFIGGQRDALGPVVVAGQGGVRVERLAAPSGRLAPFGLSTATRLTRELDVRGVFESFRGSTALDALEFATLLQRFSMFLASAAGWAHSVDLNPVLGSQHGFVAVDGLILVGDSHGPSATEGIGEASPQ